MERVSIHGKMVDFTMDFMYKIKDKDKAALHGQMEENMMVNGMKARCMVLGILQKIQGQAKRENGRVEKEFTGWMRMISQFKS